MYGLAQHGHVSSIQLAGSDPNSQPKLPDGIPPRFPRKPTIRQDGDNLVMECQLEASPLPDITWFKGDKVSVSGIGVVEADERKKEKKRCRRIVDNGEATRPHSSYSLIHLRAYLNPAHSRFPLCCHCCYLLFKTLVFGFFFARIHNCVSP